MHSLDIFNPIMTAPLLTSTRLQEEINKLCMARVTVAVVLSVDQIGAGAVKS